jgi:hypothetical protein
VGVKLQVTENTDKKVQIQFMGTEEYRYHVQGLARKKKMKVQPYLEAAVDHYSKCTAAVPDNCDSTGTDRTTTFTFKPDSLENISEENVQWVNRLLAILGSENEVVIEAIQKNLIAFCLIAGTGNEFARNDAAKADILLKAAGAVNSGKGVGDDSDRSKAKAKRVIEKHKGDRRDSGGREKGAA